MLKKYFKENGWYNYVTETDLKGPESFLMEYFKNKVHYMGHGGTCIAFATEKYDMAIKVCLKTNDVLKNKKAFLAYSKFLLDSEVKILEPKEILYDDNNFIIYTQEICNLIYSINTLSLIKILKIIMNLIDKKIKLPDLFHKNFGIHKNDIYIYDYHDQGYFYSNDRYYICHIAHIFNMYYHNSLLLGMHLDIDKLIKIDFGKDSLPFVVSNLLKSLYDYEFDKSIEYFKICISELEYKVKCSYNDYQHIDIDKEGIIHLMGHTLDKFNIVNQLLKDCIDDKFTLIDYGCSLGGIGSSVAQNYPDSKIYLNNITKNELSICNKIISDLLLTNVTIVDKNITDDKSSYDICLYFAILHHILKHMTFDNVLKMILRQIKQYAIIELPFGNDALLKKVIQDKSIDYDKSFSYLESIEKFKDEIVKYFNIINIIKIDYPNSNDLNRYVFVLKKL